MQMMTALMVMWLAATGQAVEDRAEASAEAWLELVDAERYGDSWDEAAAFVRGAVSKEDWGRSIGGARRPLGDVVSRTVKSRTYTETLPGAPDGRYVVIQYDTVFENKRRAVETITPMMDPDGEWRVSGYYIK
jgi:hypothetical protein